MESFHLPVTAIVALAVSLSALAFTAYDPAMWLYPSSTIGERDMALTTKCDRLVLRYLSSDKPSFDRLAGAMRKFIGKEPYGMLLDSTEQALNYDSRISRDRFYLLRGKILLKLGRDVEARESFRAALKWSPDNSQAQRILIGQYVETGSYDIAEKEIEKASDRSLDGDGAGRDQLVLEKITLSSSL
ncbi:hypothetical protein MNBD_NITROSPINAE03-855 [hydrothermal vent metagenome]|uniref:Uncharacterized protein n=1 Tax=hydrothermal vent metagenome TaxID=652676 RepID=A0A3B1BMP3_9ZZZZ